MKLRNIFRTALGTEHESEIIFLAVSDKRGNVGFGEIAPSPNVLGTDADLCETQLRKCVKILKSMEEITPDSLQRVLSKIRAVTPDVVAGLDIALNDLIARLDSLPLWRRLGAEHRILVTDYTVSLGDPEEMAKEACDACSRGFRTLKLKLGEDPRTDVERVERIRSALEESVTIRVDANQGWRSFKSALYVVRELEKLDVELIEQPMPRLRLYDHYLLRMMTSIPIILDESVRDIEELVHCYKLDALDGVNIKLMKSGGVTLSYELGRVAHMLGLRVMVGCMLETKVAITAAACVAAAIKAEYVDLDSPLLIDKIDGVEITGGVEYQGEKIVLPDRPGLGLEVVFD